MSERTGVSHAADAPEAPARTDTSPALGTDAEGATPEGAEAPSETPAPPAKRPRRAALRRWWARFLVLAMIVVAVLVGWRVIQYQDKRDATLDLGTVTLTAQAIPVETTLSGLITSVAVVPGQHVTAGQRMGQVLVTSPNAQGDLVQHSQPVIAPQDGVVVDEPMTVGATLTPGLPFAELYNPSGMRLVAQVTPSQLAQITPGMKADLTVQGMDQHVKAVVLRAVPQVTSEDRPTTTSSRLKLLLTPADPAQAATLIPGLRLTGTVDTRTAPHGARESVYVG